MQLLALPHDLADLFDGRDAPDPGGLAWTSTISFPRSPFVRADSARSSFRSASALPSDGISTAGTTARAACTGLCNVVVCAGAVCAGTVVAVPGAVRDDPTTPAWTSTVVSATTEPRIVANAASNFGAPVQEPPGAAASAVSSAGSAGRGCNE